MDKKKLALTMAVATTLTVSSVSSSLPTVVYAQENTNAIENEENMVENGSEEATLPEETLPEEENLPATETEDVESLEEDGNVVEQNTEVTSVQEERTNIESVSATADNNLSGNCGATENDNVTWELKQNNSDNSNPTYTLIISGSGAMMDMVTKVGQSNTQPWITYKGSITNIVVDEGVASLGSTVFRNLTACTEINLPASLTEIGNSALTSMNALSTINLASGNTSFLVDDNVLYTTGYETLVKYPQMKNLESYTVNSACKNIGTEAFHGAQQLKTVVLPTGLKEIGSWSMSGMSSLTEITIPNSVTSILSCAFNGNKAMTTLTFEENSSLETIASGAFYSSGLIGELVIPASVKTIGEETSTYGAFSIIPGLTKVSFEGGSQCTFIGAKTFNGNVGPTAEQQSALSEVIIPTSVTYIGSQAFMQNRNLKTVTILGNSEELEIDSSAFKDCSPNAEIMIGRENEKTYVNVKTNAFNSGKITLHSILTGVENNAFENSDLYGKVVVGKDGNKPISIGRWAFKGTSVDTLICKSDVSTFETEALAGADTLEKLVIESPSITVNQSWANADALTVIDMTKVENITDLSGHVWFSNTPTPLIVYLKDNSITSDKFKKNVAQVYVNGGTVDITSSDISNTLFATPTKDNYKFAGWYDNDSFIGEAVTVPQANKTYYAKWVEKTVPTISFKDDFKLDKTYDGKAVSISENDYTLTDGAGDVTFSYQVKNGDTWADVKDVPTNAGTYRVKAVVAENDNYKGAETDWKEFTIGKATPAYTLPTDLTVGKGKTLATVTLPEGFTWADETQTADELGTHEFKAVYTPEDTANYEVVDVMITVEVVPNTSLVNHAPEIEVSDKTLTVGDVFDPMENVIVKDKEDSANDLVVDVTHYVDTNKAGVYEVTYTVTDTKGATTIKKIYVTVNPKMEVLNEVPTIHAENITITVGDKFDPLKDVTATDKEDGTLTDKIEVLNDTVDINKAGVYEVTYKVTDSNGATVTKTIAVTVKEKNVDTPTTPEKPNNTTKPDNTTKPNKTDTPQTGDMTNLGVFASMLAGSSGALAVLLGKRRKNNKND